MLRASHTFRLTLFLALGLAGCSARSEKFTFNPGAPGPHYQELASKTESRRAGIVQASYQQAGPGGAVPPLLLSDSAEPVYWNLRLEETMQIALSNSPVLRELGGLILRSPASVGTVHDPAIVATDPRFGVEAALSEFDAVFSSRAVNEKNDRAENNLSLGAQSQVFQQDYLIFQNQIQKRAATGSLFALRHNLDYDYNSSITNKYPGVWGTNVEGEIRQPLLQNAGLQYNRIAGPRSQFGLPSGLLIARVNADVSLADFELGVRDLVSNIENAYWDLYFAYRDLDAKIAARNAALESWQRVHALFVAGRKGGEAEKEAEAREQYFRFQEEVQNALVGRPVEGTQTNNGSSGGSFRGVPGVHVAERRLRLLAGLPINDGRLIRPAEEPPMARVVFDWDEVLAESLTRRPELRRQASVIKRRELELIAAKNYLLPQLDAVGLYRWRGFGHDLLAPDGPSNDLYAGAFNNFGYGDQQEWQMGLEFSMPLGFRRGYAAVRNAQLLVSRDRAILRQQEEEVTHGLSNAVAEADRAWKTLHTAGDRRSAAREQLSSVQSAYEADRAPFNLVMEAQRRLADAESRYFAAMAEYSIAIKNVHFEKGSLLEHNQVYLAEGPGPDAAASNNGRRRSNAPLNYILRPTARATQPPALLENHVGRISNPSDLPTPLMNPGHVQQLPTMTESDVWPPKQTNDGQPSTSP